jgi:hypothetical protein
MSLSELMMMREVGVPKKLLFGIFIIVTYCNPPQLSKDSIP